MIRGLAPILLALVTAAFVLPSPVSAAADSPELSFHDGRFEPASFTVAANQRLQLKVTNKSDQPIEFESFELNRERVVQPGGSIVVYLPSLNPGTYHFFDDFHHEVAQGTLVVR